MTIINRFVCCLLPLVAEVADLVYKSEPFHLFAFFPQKYSEAFRGKGVCLLPLIYIVFMPSVTSQARYWLLTIPEDGFNKATFDLSRTGVGYLKGQLEEAPTTGYRHWQLVAHFPKKIRLNGVKRIFGDRCHAEPSRSDAADAYVWKEETRVAGTQFELGSRSVVRGRSVDWQRVLDSAKAGSIQDIPPDILVRNYSAIKRIGVDFAQPLAIERSVRVYVGRTGLGKSRRAWHEAGLDAYPKDPRTKFWCGYAHQQSVVIDEFRGDIGINSVLRWFDRYPVCVETKGSSVVLKARDIWITSNIHPRDWYPQLDEVTKEALLRRLQVVEFTEEWLPPLPVLPDVEQIPNVEEFENLFN